MATPVRLYFSPWRQEFYGENIHCTCGKCVEKWQMLDRAIWPCNLSDDHLREARRTLDSLGDFEGRALWVERLNLEQTRRNAYHEAHHQNDRVVAIRE